MNPPTVAIITARGGSKGIPRKNLRLLAGKPLIAHTILAAKEALSVTRTIVSTEDEEIAQVSRDFGAEVIVRPSELAQDQSSSESVVAHVLSTLKASNTLTERFVLLQPTSPLRTSKHIEEALSKFASARLGSLVAVTEPPHTPYKMLREVQGLLQPLFDWKSLTQPRQSLPKTWIHNGAIYVGFCESFLKSPSFFAEPVLAYAMDENSSIDIDRPIDFEICERILKV